VTWSLAESSSFRDTI